MKLVAIDVGNSHTKILMNDKIFILNYDKNFEDELRKILTVTEINSENKIIISSVNSEKTKEINSVFDELKISFENANNYLTVQKIIDFSEISGIGNDRKLGIIGATNFAKPPFITVDCGTTITVNVVSQDLKCLGGIIFPGLKTQAKSLKTWTSQLPQIEINNQIFDSKKNIFSAGKNTVDAITVGILSSTSGGIISFINSTVEENFLTNVSIIFTGGNGSLMQEICSDYFSKSKNSSISEITVVPNLVLEGIKLCGRVDNFC